MTTRALILAGHGSHISPNTAGIVWRYVDQLRAWGVADEITACFWKESPAFSQVLNTVVADEITIVPVFTAQGYFTKSVIPAEMSLDGALTRRDGRTIHYTKTMGEHPYLAQIVRQRVIDVLETYALKDHETIVALIGHGTKRDSNSRTATREQAHILRKQALVAQVLDVYLDDDPAIPTIYQSTDKPNIIALPYFLASGSHVTIDVPSALGITLESSPALVDGRHVYYTPPIGTDDAICNLILELARDTEQAFEINPTSTNWSGFPQTGREALLQAIDANGIVRFGQLELTANKVKPIGRVDQPKLLTSPQALRQHIRVPMLGTPFRPLATSTDLPNDWCVLVESPEDVHAVVETVYPGAVADWASHQNSTFAFNNLQSVAQRQQGMFRDIDKLSINVIENTVDAICGKCVRHATWFYGASPENEIPCAEACNLWLSTAKEAIAV